MKQFGHLPKRGETIVLDKWQFSVLRADNRRIYLLEVKIVKTYENRKAASKTG